MSKVTHAKSKLVAQSQPAPIQNQPVPAQIQPAAPAVSQPVPVQHATPLAPVFESPGHDYKGYNACCCYTVDKGARTVALTDTVISVLSFLTWTGFLFLFELDTAKLSALQALLCIVVTLIVIDLASMMLSIAILKSLNNFRSIWIWMPVAWITTQIFRIMIWIAFLIFWEPLLRPYDNFIVLDGTLIFRADELSYGYMVHLVILMCLYVWFILVMLGYVRYKKVNRIQPGNAEAFKIDPSPTQSLKTSQKKEEAKLEPIQNESNAT